MRQLIVMIAFACLACRSAPMPKLGARAASVAPVTADRALELVASLPVGADRCLVVRPAQLSARQRALVVAVSQADALAFLEELDVHAYVEAVHERRDRPPGQVALLWVGVSDAAVRAALTRRGQRVSFDRVSAECTGGACPARARFVAPHVLRIERGEPVIGSTPGVEAHCQRLAAQHPTALELGFTRSRSLLSATLGVMPLTGSSIMSARGDGVHVQRIDLMRSSDDAAEVVDDRSAADVLLGPLSALASGLHRQHTDAEVRTDYDLLWEDLLFASEAEAHVAAADRQSAAIERAELDTTREPTQREDVIAQLGQTLELIREASGEPRVALARKAAERLQRALALDPEDEGLALLLTELYLSELAEAEAGSPLLQRFMPRTGASPRWLELKRHAAALHGETALAAALAGAKLVEPRRAHTVAASIIARLHEGASYLEAERGALGQERAPAGASTPP